MLQCHEALRLAASYIEEPDSLVLTESDNKAHSTLILTGCVEINITPFEITNWTIVVV